MDCLQAFAYLQVLDLLTTLVGFRIGAEEASPFGRLLFALHFSPVVALACIKAAAVVLAALCLWRKRQRVIRWVNYWYAGLVIWNLGVILVSL